MKQWKMILFSICLAALPAHVYAGEPRETSRTPLSIQDIFPPDPEVILPPFLAPKPVDPEVCYNKLQELVNSLWYVTYTTPPIQQSKYLYFTDWIIPISGNEYWGDHWMLIGIDSDQNITGTVYRGESFEGGYLTVDASYNVGSYSYDIDNAVLSGLFAMDRAFSDSYDLYGWKIY